jgi:hypothetical protein
MASRRPGPGEIVVGASGLLLLVAMFLPWFGLDGRVRVPGVGAISIGAQNQNAWEAFGGVDVVLALAAALAILVLVVAFFAEPPPALVLAVIVLAGLAALLIVYRLIDVPDIEIDAPGDASYEVARRLGAFLGLLCTAGMTWGASLIGVPAQVPARKPERHAGAKAAPEAAPASPPEPAPASPTPAAAPRRARAKPAPPPEPAAPARAPASPSAPPASRRARAKPAPASPAIWSRAAIDAACQPAWRRYDRRLGARYERYFEDHPELAGDQRASARDLAAALPPGWDSLAEAVPPDAWQRLHLSGKSSQTLSVGLLGVAARRDPALGWLWDALAPLPPPASAEPRLEFEHAVAPDLLGERPRQTSFDALVDDPNAVIGIEAKWRQHGVGACLCRGDGVGPAEGERCSRRVESRDPYWEAAGALIGRAERAPGSPCPISPLYEVVRHAAALRALAGEERAAALLLLYDAENPYFAPTGDWPGWPAKLDELIGDFRFVATSWQELVPHLPLDAGTRAWAADKHGLD